MPVWMDLNLKVVLEIGYFVLLFCNSHSSQYILLVLMNDVAEEVLDYTEQQLGQIVSLVDAALDVDMCSRFRVGL